jgi:GNAT superfamily N-acetyltransferase
MPDEIQIRPARDSDAEPLVRLWLELIEHHRRLAPPGLAVPKPEVEPLRAELQRGIRSTRCCLLVAEGAGGPVGFLFAEVDVRGPEGRERSTRGWLHETYVEAPSRGCGVAERLVREGYAWLQGQGVERVCVRVESSNPEALAFWLGQGFRERARVLERSGPPC